MAQEVEPPAVTEDFLALLLNYAVEKNFGHEKNVRDKRPGPELKSDRF